MKTQTSFVGTDSAVHLHTVSAVDTKISYIIHPWHTEHDDPFSLYHSFKNSSFFVLWIFFDEGNDRLCYFKYCLQKLRLGRVSSFYQLHEFVNGRTFCCYHICKISLDNVGGYIRQKRQRTIYKIINE